MHLPNNQPNLLVTLAGHIKSLVEQLVKDLPSDGDNLSLSNISNLLNEQDKNRFYLIQTGRVIWQPNEKLVLTADDGDVIGLLHGRQLSEGPFDCDGDVTLVPYSLSALENLRQQSSEIDKIWSDYLMAVACFYSQALAEVTPKQFKPATGFLQFDEGDVIINQGEKAECVYTLLEGSAEVIHDQVKVGEIAEQETFGAIAVFTNQPRNATVVATSSCSVLAVRKDEFLDLVSHQPQVCMSMIEEMADKINQLNRQVLNLQK